MDSCQGGEPAAFWDGSAVQPAGTHKGSLPVVCTESPRVLTSIPPSHPGIPWQGHLALIILGALFISLGSLSPKALFSLPSQRAFKCVTPSQGDTSFCLPL